jgi:poly-gamma-glutamate synthase PgsB/CapB
MALRPELQWFVEHRLLNSHIGVITNIRADHEDVMGNGIAAITAALANTIPRNGALVTGPVEYQLLLEAGCLPATTNIHLADADELSPETFLGFSYEIFPQNIALALLTCELAGVNRDTAIAGMRQACPDSGHLTVSRVDLSGATVTIINALAANDPDSTSLLYKRYVTNKIGCTLVWLHGRPDRKLRSVQLCQALTELHAGLFLISGDISFLENRLRCYGVNRDRIIAYSGESALNYLATVPQPVTIFAAGNIHGLHSALLPTIGD